METDQICTQANARFITFALQLQNMSATTRGKISFIQHDKQYATIEYMANGKKKSINGIVSEFEQKKLKELKLIKKVHHFHVGDEVSFVIEPSPRGDKMVAARIQYITNNELANVLYKASLDNKLVGYLKEADGKLFVKETGSHFFFPLVLSPWEHEPSAHAINEQILFSLDNLDNPEKVTARLFKPHYIPEFKKVQQYFKDKAVIEAPVYKVTEHGIYVNIVGESIQGKLPVDSEKDLPKEGDKIKVRISFLSSMRIVLERLS
jgi:hypothetical protein